MYKKLMWMEVHIYSVNAESQAGNSVHAESQAGDI